VLRRAPLSLPHAEEVPRLAALLDATDRPPPIPDPDRLVAAALAHGVGGYVLAAVEAERVRLPEAAARRLAGGHARRRLHSVRLRRELGDVVEAVESACGAPPILLKGPAVADRFYPDPRLRPFVDLDLLVPRAALRDAVAGLGGRGWEPREEFRAGYAERHGHDVHLVRRGPAGALHLELHWRMGDDDAASGFGHALLAPAAPTLEVEGRPVRVPTVEHQLLGLAIHLLSDRGKRLSWLQDIRLVAAAADARQWDAAFAGADDLGLGWVLHRALDYPARHLGFARPRPRPPGPPPPFGPLRAVEALDLRASPHVGRLVALGWRERLPYLRAVLVPTRAGLRGTVGRDGDEPTWRLAARHARQALLGLASPPRG
jgi:hypothetical protein